MFSRCTGSRVGLLREMPMCDPPRKWIRLTPSMVKRTTRSMFPLHEPLEAVPDADHLHTLELGPDGRRADDAVDARSGTARDQNRQLLVLTHDRYLLAPGGHRPTLASGPDGSADPRGALLLILASILGMSTDLPCQFIGRPGYMLSAHKSHRTPRSEHITFRRSHLAPTRPARCSTRCRISTPPDPSWNRLVMQAGWWRVAPISGLSFIMLIMLMMGQCRTVIHIHDCSRCQTRTSSRP